MAKNSEKEVKDYRHDTSKRKNNPPAGMAGQGRTPDTPKQEYTYNPHLPPILRSDPHGDADKVAAWFVDSDYDGRTFCITQAFFPDKNAWNKIARDLKGVIDAESFETFSGTESFPFPAGKHACVVVKVIDPRGNEVMRVHNLGD